MDLPSLCVNILLVETLSLRHCYHVKGSSPGQGNPATAFDNDMSILSNAVGNSLESP